MDKAKAHMATAVSTVRLDLRLKGTLQPLYSRDICPSDFLLFGWSKEKLEQRQITDADQFFDALDDIFTSLSVDTIEDEFRDWIHWLEQVIE
jgi:hypothetical protein